MYMYVKYAELLLHIDPKQEAIKEVDCCIPLMYGLLPTETALVQSLSHKQSVKEFTS